MKSRIKYCVIILMIVSFCTIVMMDKKQYQGVVTISLPGYIEGVTHPDIGVATELGNSLRDLIKSEEFYLELSEFSDSNIPYDDYTQMLVIHNHYVYGFMDIYVESFSGDISIALANEIAYELEAYDIEIVKLAEADDVIVRGTILRNTLALIFIYTFIGILIYIYGRRRKDAV